MLAAGIIAIIATAYGCRRFGRAVLSYAENCCAEHEGTRGAAAREDRRGGSCNGQRLSRVVALHGKGV